MNILRKVWVARQDGLPDGFPDLLADCVADGRKLLTVLQEDWDAGAMRFDGPGEALFAAHAGETLLGVAGLTRDPYAADGGTARVRRLYVRRAGRGQGAGRALLAAIETAAAAHGWARLRVRAPAESFGFYEACGFLRAVGESAATHMRPL